jgi:hypothetical protein
MVNNTKSSISLISYLIPDNTGISINLIPGQKEDLMHQPSQEIFQVVSESNPFSKIIQADVISDEWDTIGPAFLMIQKDIYTVPDVLMPLNNIDVEKNWQQAFLYYSRNCLSSPPLILDSQVNESGALIPFQPLWFCRNKQVYFQPLCPDCGKPLEQCYDDDVLGKNGLQPYSDSLQRYLYCPDCIESKKNGSVFYVPEGYKDAPACLKNCNDLIREMGVLKGKEYLSDDLPCVVCDNYQACFGNEDKAVSEIAVFSFFPFYMILFKISSANAIDFMSPQFRPPVAKTEGEEADDLSPEPDIKQQALDKNLAAKKDIHRILKNIMKGWQDEAGFPHVKEQHKPPIIPEKESGGQIPAPVPEGFDANDPDRTVIISSREDITQRIAAYAKKQDLEKTVVIPRKADPDIKQQTDADRISSQMEKTVIITADSMGEQMVPPTSQENHNDMEMEKTVIINPKVSALNSPEVSDEVSGEVSGADDETVIIRHDPASSNHDLEKTMIISPGKVESGHQLSGSNAQDSYASGSHLPGSQFSGSDRTIIFGDDFEDAELVKETRFSEENKADDTLEKTVILNPKK